MDIWDWRKECVFWEKRFAMNDTSSKDINGKDDSVL